jgi:hypothetical protein
MAVEEECRELEAVTLNKLEWDKQEIRRKRQAEKGSQQNDEMQKKKKKKDKNKADRASRRAALTEYEYARQVSSKHGNAWSDEDENQERMRVESQQAEQAIPRNLYEDRDSSPGVESEDEEEYEKSFAGKRDEPPPEEEEEEEVVEENEPPLPPPPPSPPPKTPPKKDRQQAPPQKTPPKYEQQQTWHDEPPLQPQPKQPTTQDFVEKMESQNREGKVVGIVNDI